MEFTQHKRNWSLFTKSPSLPPLVLEFVYQKVLPSPCVYNSTAFHNFYQTSPCENMSLLLIFIIQNLSSPSPAVSSMHICIFPMCLARMLLLLPFFST